MIVAVAGCLVYALSANPKLAELGRLAFGSGLLAFLLQNGTRIIQLGK